MKPCVFIQTNNRQIAGALVAEHSLRRNSAHADEFDVKIIHQEDYPYYRQRQGQLYLRDGVKRPWNNEDLQSFTTVRFMPPELMGYQGRALVIDPDVFAVADVWELLSRDMQGKAILCRSRSGAKGLLGRCMATSVMLLDCAKLTHWNVERQFNEMFEFKIDYADWICLRLEPRETIGLIESAWNDFDKLTPNTKMVHNTRRKTQPWKAGLPVDFTPAERVWGFPPFGWLMRVRRHFFGDHGLMGKYKRHPDSNQENFFFGLLHECMDKGAITEAMLREEMRQNHVRHDAFEVLKRTPPLPPPPHIALTA